MQFYLLLCRNVLYFLRYFFYCSTHALGAYVNLFILRNFSCFYRRINLPCWAANTDPHHSEKNLIRIKRARQRREQSTKLKWNEQRQLNRTQPNLTKKDRSWKNKKRWSQAILPRGRIPGCRLLRILHNKAKVVQFSCVGWQPRLTFCNEAPQPLAFDLWSGQCEGSAEGWGQQLLSVDKGWHLAAMSSCSCPRPRPRL